MAEHNNQLLISNQSGPQSIEDVIMMYPDAEEVVRHRVGELSMILSSLALQFAQTPEDAPRAKQAFETMVGLVAAKSYTDGISSVEGVIQ